VATRGITVIAASKGRKGFRGCRVRQGRRERKAPPGGRG
jgi:hypothetical protein